LHLSTTNLSRKPSSSLWTAVSLLSFASVCALLIMPGASAQGRAAAAAPGAAAPAAAAPAGPAAFAGGGGEDVTLKRIDDLMWYQKIGDIADIDKSEIGGAPNPHVRNKKAPGATNPLIIHVYTFIPKKLDRSKKQPLLVYVHQGVHQSLDTTIDAHQVRELLEQGYTIVACDYRGSTGYGGGYYQAIDYGGLEVDDVYRSMQWMLAKYSYLDPKRVATVGSSR
jgi:acetyl esterase/lipase